MPSSSRRSPARSITPPLAALRTWKGTRGKGAAEPSPARRPPQLRTPPWPAQPPVLAPVATGGAGLAGASSCSAPGGAPGSEIRAPGAGRGGPGSSPHLVERRPGCQAQAASLPRRASAPRLLAAGVSPASQRPALPATRWAQPPAPTNTEEPGSPSSWLPRARASPRPKPQRALVWVMGTIPRGPRHTEDARARQTFSYQCR